MIKIFNANDTNFSSNGNIAINPLKCTEVKKKSLNGWYINLEIPIKYKDYIAKDLLCVIKTKSKLNPQAFRIDNIEYNSRKIIITANHVMFDTKNYFLVDVRPTNINAQNALSYINERTDKKSPFSFYSDISITSTAYFVRKSLFEALQIIEERWNGIFDADNWNISFKQNIGIDRGEVIAYGKNLQNIKIFEDWSSVCTKLYPVGSNGLLLPEKYIESTIQYKIPYTRTISFETQLETDEQNEENLLNELRDSAKKYLDTNQYPKVSYEIISNINQLMEIGDNVHIKHPLVDLITEVLEYEYDGIAKRIKKIIFGNYTRDVKNRFDSIKQSIQDTYTKLSKQDIVINEQTKLINSLNKNGYVYIDDNEILILDKLPKEKAKNVWRFGLGGIGFSSNGYEGPFELAMTSDGQINADFITTGTMSISRIEGLENTLGDIKTSISLNNGKIEQLVYQLENYIGESSAVNTLFIEDCSPKNLEYLSIKGNISPLQPGNIYPSESLTLKAIYLIVDKTSTLSDEAKKIRLPIDYLRQYNDVSDEFVFDNGQCSIVRRIGIDEDNNYYILENEVIEELGNLEIELFDGDNYIYVTPNYNTQLYARYPKKKESEIYATKVELSSSIKETADNITLETSEKFDDQNSRIASLQTALDGVNITVSSQKTELDSLSGQVIAIDGSLDEMQYKFNTDALKIAKTNDPVNSTIDNTGLKVYNYTALKAIFNNNGSGIDTLIVTGTAQIGYLKSVKTIENGKKYTDIFHLEELISDLTDLEVSS